MFFEGHSPRHLVPWSMTDRTVNANEMPIKSATTPHPPPLRPGTKDWRVSSAIAKAIVRRAQIRTLTHGRDLSAGRPNHRRVVSEVNKKMWTPLRATCSINGATPIWREGIPDMNQMNPASRKHEMREG